MKKCPNCGVRNDGDSLFCMACGSSLLPSARNTAPKTKRTFKLPLWLIIIIFEIILLVAGAVFLAKYFAKNTEAGSAGNRVENNEPFDNREGQEETAEPAISTPEPTLEPSEIISQVDGGYVGETITINEEPVITYTGVLDSYGSKDAYVYTAPRDGTFFLEISDIEEGESAMIVCCDSNGTRSYLMTAVLSLIGGETYTFQIEQFAGFPEYTFSIYQQKETVDISAATVVYDQTTFIEQQNVYTFTPSVSGDYQFHLEETPYDCTFQMLMWDNGNNIIVDTTFGSATVFMDAGETYVVHIEQHGGMHSYKLAIDFIGGIDLTRETSTYQRHRTLAANDYATYAIQTDGTVLFAYRDERTILSEGAVGVADWIDIIDIAADGFDVIGLQENGEVVASVFNEELANWSDIIDVEMGSYFTPDNLECHVVGLKNDGTVLATGFNGYDACNVSEWTDIVDIAAGACHTAGLKSDGTVITTVGDDLGWSDVVEIEAAQYHTFGLRADGTVLVACHDVSDDRPEVDDVHLAEIGWSHIVSIYAGYEGGAAEDYLIGIKADGTIVRAGESHLLYQSPVEQFMWEQQENVVAVTGGSWGYMAVLSADGNVMHVGRNPSNASISDWTDIQLPEFSNIRDSKPE